MRYFSQCISRFRSQHANQFDFHTAFRIHRFSRFMTIKIGLQPHPTAFIVAFKERTREMLGDNDKT